MHTRKRKTNSTPKHVATAEIGPIEKRTASQQKENIARYATNGTILQKYVVLGKEKECI